MSYYTVLPAFLILAAIILPHWCYSIEALDGYVDRNATVGSKVRTMQFQDSTPIRLRLALGNVPMVVTSNSSDAARLFAVVGEYLVLKSRLPTPGYYARGKYALNVSIDSAYYAYLPIPVPLSARIVASINVYVVEYVGAESITTATAKTVTGVYTTTNRPTTTTSVYSSTTTASVIVGYVERGAKVGTHVRTAPRADALPVRFPLRRGPPLKVTSNLSRFDTDDGNFEIADGYLVVQTRLPDVRSYPKKVYSVNVSVDSDFYLFPAPTHVYLLSSVDIHLLDDATMPTGPPPTYRTTTSPYVPSTSQASTGFTADGIQSQPSSTKDPLNTVMVLFRPKEESEKVDLMGILIRIVLLALLAALLWKVLQCILCRPSDGRSLEKSSYTINLL